MNTKYQLKDMRDAYAIEHVPMTVRESEIFVMCAMLDEQEKGLFDGEDAELLGFPGVVLYRRLQRHHSIPISKGLAALAVNFSKTPGDIVLWAFTFHKLWQSCNRMVTVEDFADHFPMGIPTKRAIDQIWEDQKADTRGEESPRNLIDDEVNWA